MHVAGLPRHPATKQEMPPTPYQLEFVYGVIKTVTNTGNISDEEWKRLAHKFHVNKGRQMGFTEIVLRMIFHFCFSRYAGSNVGIIAATTGALARKDLRRFYNLFKHIQSTISQQVKSTKEGVCMKIINDTIVWAFAESEEAITGDTDYACIFMDESAKWKMVDDKPVFNSIIPIVDTNGSDLFLVSTPKGPTKMFHNIWKEPEDFIKLEYNLYRAQDNLYTKSQIESMIANSKADPNQEYLCKFTIGEDSILGAITDEDRGTFSEWDNNNDDDEDDSYIEDNSEDDWS